MEQYYQFTSSSEEVMKERLRPQAAEAVKMDLVIEAIGKAEGIEVTEDEVNEELKKLGERYKQDPATLKQTLMARGEYEFYKQSLINDKTAKFLVENNA